MHKQVFVARFVAPAVLTLGAVLSSSTAFAGAAMSKLPMPTKESRALAATAHTMKSTDRHGFAQATHGTQKDAHHTVSHMASHARR